MGMYDTVTVEMDLPDGTDPAGIQFQTKALDSTLTDYKIDKDGKLWQMSSGWFDGEALEEPILIKDTHLDMFISNGLKRYVIRFTDGIATRIKVVPDIK